MNLVISANLNTSTLLKMVTKDFSFFTIPNDIQKDNSNKTLLPFNNHLGRIVIYQCINCMGVLYMIWQTPCLHDYPRHAVSEFLMHHLDYEGKGSISNYLQYHNLALSVTSHVTVKTDHFYLITMEVTLTEDGYSNISNVIKCVFEFMELFKAMSIMHFRDLWKDFIKIKIINFFFGEKESLSKLLV